jgi:tRNA dimethylallyltransferase
VRSLTGELTVHALDRADLATWTQNVRDPAIDILAKFLAGEGLPDPTTLSPLAAQHLAPPPPKL